MITRTTMSAMLLTAAIAMLNVQCKSRDPVAPPPGNGANAAAATTNDAPGAATRNAPAPSTGAAASGGALDDAHRAKARKMLDKAAEFLLSKRDDKGVWSMQQRKTAAPAITAMALKALVQHPDYGPKHPAVVKGYQFLLTFKQPDGGIYSPGEGGSYTAAVALMALAAAKDPQYDGAIKDLKAYLKGLQIVPGSQSSDGKVLKEGDRDVGGVGYGKGPGRPDLSVTGMWSEALHEAGVAADDPAMQRALEFVTRLQNHSETNKQEFAVKGANDGGFIYTFPSGRGPAAATGGRSYGSMTYTGFKTMLYAGLDRKDPRVAAALEWIRRYWQLKSNPNMPSEQSRSGLYYYYHVFAKALRVYGQGEIADSTGAKHNWRHELIDVLADEVQSDGSWINDSDRWWEGDSVLCTCYAMLALEEAIKPLAGE